MALKVPLTKSQVDAAIRLQQGLSQWRLSEFALQKLRDVLLGFSPEECLLKSAAVNAIYGTNVVAIVRMAKRVQEVITGLDLESVASEIVDSIAALPAVDNEKPRKRTSFAANGGNGVRATYRQFALQARRKLQRRISVVG